jgi:hypothetical protein
MRAFEEGPIEGSGIDDGDFDWFKHCFYERMGWDPDTGEPTGECLQELELDRLL